MPLRVGMSKKIGGVHVGVSKTIGCGGKKNNNGWGFWAILGAIILLPITLIVLCVKFCKWAYKKTQEQKAADPDSVWYKRTWGIILLLVIFFPLGLYIMWKYADWNKYIKIGASVLVGIVVIAVIVSPGGGKDGNSSIMEEPSTIYSGEILKYDADELAKLIDNGDNFEDSLIGTRIQISGIVKENELTSDDVYIYGDFKNGGWYMCKLENQDDVSRVKPKDIVTLEGTFDEFNGHAYLNSCIILSCETPTEETTEKETEKKEEPATSAAKVTAENEDKESANDNSEQAEAVTEKPTEKITEQVVAERPQEQEKETEDPDAQITVYRTKTGKKYHYENPCGSGTYIPCTLAEAKAKGLTPCEKCVLH